MNGIFDSTSNRTYNDAKPNYDPDDGVDIVECHCESCSYRDIERGICLFETCITNQSPFSIYFHTRFTRKCQLCDSKFTIEFGENEHPFIYMPTICEDCRNKLKSLLQIERDGNHE